METYLLWLFACIGVVGGLLSLYWFVEVYDRKVRHWRDARWYIDREPEPACKRDYRP